MKKILILLLLLGTLGACKKKTNTPPLTSLEQLAPATQEGANTAGCLVDGEAFLPTKRNNTPFSLQYHNGQDFALLMADNSKNSLLLIRIYNTELEVGETYQLIATQREELSSGVYSIHTETPPSPFYYSTNSDITGELTISAHNFDKAYLSGTFWFDAINSEGKIIKIREGRFDMDY